eukprot:18546-Heterococcus_DN1.PRE.1
MITAFGNGEQWQKAEQMYSNLQINGLKPNLFTYNAMITAYGDGEQWQKAEQMYADLQNNGLKANT